MLGRNCPIEGVYPYVYLDGINLKRTKELICIPALRGLYHRSVRVEAQDRLSHYSGENERTTEGRVLRDAAFIISSRAPRLSQRVYPRPV